MWLVEHIRASERRQNESTESLSVKDLHTGTHSETQGYNMVTTQGHSVMLFSPSLSVSVIMSDGGYEGHHIPWRYPTRVPEAGWTSSDPDNNRSPDGADITGPTEGPAELVSALWDYSGNLEIWDENGLDNKWIL